MSGICGGCFFIFALNVFFAFSSLAGDKNILSKHSNKLIHAKSPYLLQHAHNPVDWHPWDKEAFELARKENKPIFLSIGYAACHWCHVMECESFENEKLAELMNDAFLCIKVDREEQPAVDNIYMRVCQMLTGAGGWPLTIIMTPDKKPFLAATYMPLESRFGRTGMLQLVPRIAELWKTKRPEILESADKIADALKNNSEISFKAAVDNSILHKAFEELKDSFDRENGGFGAAPKFPSPHKLLFLLRYWKMTENDEALKITLKTLQKMRRGGIYDHVGRGFHRYSTDANWLLPHFEKMLYDQAMMTMAYTEAFQTTKNDFYADTAKEVIEYVLRDMTSPEGAFFTAEDADSDGEEGKFYTWSHEELEKILNKDEFELASRFFNIKKEGNFQDEAARKNTGQNILHLKKTQEEYKEDSGLDGKAFDMLTEAIRKKLFLAREKRTKPLKDTKILADWNGLMIAALSKAACAFNSEEYLKAARKDADFIVENMMTEDKRLFHRYKDGDAGIAGKLDDYAFMTWGLLELYETTFETKYLKTALDLSSILEQRFHDKENKAFFLTPDDDEKLLIRPKDAYDGAFPSGNSVMTLNLLRISRISGNAKYEKTASEIFEAFAQQANRTPSAFAQMMSGLAFAKSPAFEIVIAGEKNSRETKETLRIIRENYLPFKVVVLHSKEDAEIRKIAEYIEGQEAINNRTTVYICKNFTCEKPIVDVKELRQKLKISK